MGLKVVFNPFTGKFDYTSVEDAWLSYIDQTGLTGDKSGSFNLTTTGKATFGSTYQAVLGDDANTRAGYFTDGVGYTTLTNGGYGLFSTWTSEGNTLTAEINYYDNYAAKFDLNGLQYVYLCDGIYAINVTGNQVFTSGYIVDNLGSSTISIDTNARILYDSTGNAAYDWNSGLIGYGNVLGIDTQNRILYASDGSTPMLDWSTDGTVDLDDNALTTTGTGTFGTLIIPSKSTTGDPTAIEGLIYINTYDNKVRIYADGAWRDLATW